MSRSKTCQALNMQTNPDEYEIVDEGTERVLILNGVEHRTYYSTAVIEAIIEREGIDRTPRYFRHKDDR